jgi:proline iminopeptidase
MMAEAKLAPNLPDWIVEHANRYLASGGTEGHLLKRAVPGRGEINAPALLLTTTGRKSGEKFIFPLFYGSNGDGYFVIASKGGAPQHPGWYRNILANPDVEVQVGTKKLKARAGQRRATSASDFGKKRSNFGLPTPITRSGPNAKYWWSCWTLSIKAQGRGTACRRRYQPPLRLRRTAGASASMTAPGCGHGFKPPGEAFEGGDRLGFAGATMVEEGLSSEASFPKT